MKRTSIYLVVVFLLVGCTVPSRFVVTSIGYEPSEVQESFIYTMPKTSVKVTVHYERELFIPGPYADYAQRMLGIEGVKKRRDETFSITSANLMAFEEPDPLMFMSMNSIEGPMDTRLLEWAETNGLIIRSDFNVDENIVSHSVEDQIREFIYKDVTMEPNMELLEKTIYKTIITDTSFVKVPITTEQIEMKTLGKKAEEAAKLILEIRSDRYYVAAGLIDPFPDNFEMNTSLEGLDRLEQSYLSLFIGRTFKEEFIKEYYFSPSGKAEKETVTLDSFSKKEGIKESGELPIQLIIDPEGKSASLRNYYPQRPDENSYNRFYYRVPEFCTLSIVYNNNTLASKRLSVYQSGALVNQFVRTEE